MFRSFEWMGIWLAGSVTEKKKFHHHGTMHGVMGVIINIIMINKTMRMIGDIFMINGNN